MILTIKSIEAGNYYGIERDMHIRDVMEMIDELNKGDQIYKPIEFREIKNRIKRGEVINFANIVKISCFKHKQKKLKGKV